MILLDQLHFQYFLHDFSLFVPKLQLLDGTNIAVLGASGAGKTTLLRLLFGEILPDSGSISVNNTLLTPETIPQMRHIIDYIPQIPEHFSESATEYLRMKISDTIPPHDVEILIDYALNILHLSHLKKRIFSTLSITEKKGIALAAVLARQCNIMLLDDPTGLLDRETRMHFISSLQFLPATKIFATGDLELALSLCSRAIILKNGEIIADGNPQVLLRNVTLMSRVGLYLPESVQRCEKCRYFQKTIRNFHL